MSWLGVEWLYGPKDKRRGPFSKSEIQDLIKRGLITSETRLCERGEKTDYPAIKIISPGTINTGSGNEWGGPSFDGTPNRETGLWRAHIPKR